MATISKDVFIKACAQNRSRIVQKFIQNPELQAYIQEGLLQAYKARHLQTIQILSPFIGQQHLVAMPDEDLLMQACKLDDTHLFQVMWQGWQLAQDSSLKNFFSKSLPSYPIFNTMAHWLGQQEGEPLQDRALVYACQEGAFNIVRFILLKLNANIHCQEDLALTQACMYGHMEVVKFLVESPELQEHASISAGDHWPLHGAIANSHLEVAKYIISRISDMVTEQLWQSVLCTAHSKKATPALLSYLLCCEKTDIQSLNAKNLLDILYEKGSAQEIIPVVSCHKLGLPEEHARNERLKAIFDMVHLHEKLSTPATPTRTRHKI